ncbi:MAG: DUF998 domain-containing protein [Candidatus Freyarchaeum deiterrae]
MAKRTEKKDGAPRIVLIGGIFAVASMVVSLVFVLGAVFTYTIFPLRPIPFSGILSGLPYPYWTFNTGYSMTSQAISELGIGPSAFMFNVGLIIAGILGIPVFPGLQGLFRGSIIAKIAAVFGAIGAVGAIGVGLFPMILTPYHGLFAFTFFICSGVAIVLLSIKIFRSTTVPKALAIYGFIFVVVDVIFILLLSVIAEWAVYFLISTWILAAGIWVLVKRNAIEV